MKEGACGWLYPLSAMPRWAVRDSTDAVDIERFVLEFSRMNDAHIHAARIVIDLATRRLYPHARDGIPSAHGMCPNWRHLPWHLFPGMHLSTWAEGRPEARIILRRALPARRLQTW